VVATPDEEVTPEHRISYITIIANNDKKTTVTVIPKMIDFSMNVVYNDRGIVDSTMAYPPPGIKLLTFGGKPLENSDGSYWSEIRRD
jgi:hypothetical protein